MSVDQRYAASREAEQRPSLLKRLFPGKPTKDRKATRRDPALGGLWGLRVMRGLFVVGLVTGVVGGGKALLTPPPEPPAAEPVVEVPRDVGVGGFAELYVASWLGAGQDNPDVLAPFYPEPIDLSSVSSGSFWAARTTTVAVDEVDDGYWAVTVAADVLADPVEEEEQEESGFTPAGIRFYTVGVVEADGGFVATGLPAQVPAPPTLESPSLMVDVLHEPRDDLEPIARALEGFFDALLTGRGDLERFIAPETVLSPVSPAPFSDTEVRSLGAQPEEADPNRLLVRAEVVVTDDTETAQVMQYTTVMTQREERWEVVELVAAPPVERNGGQ